MKLIAAFAVSVSLALGAGASARAQVASQAYEQPPRVKLDDVLPPRVKQSGHHRVSDEVTTLGNMLGFRLESTQGDYQVLSLAMLLERVHEVLVLAQAVDDYQRNNQQLAAELRGVMQVGGDSAMDILTSPIKTTGSLVNQFFVHNIGDTLEELGNISDPNVRRVRDPEARIEKIDYESYQPEDPVLAAHKRSVAAHLDLDVYSTNPRVQAFLDTLAYARTSGNRSAGMATLSLPRGVEVRIANGRIANDIRNIVSRDTIRDLYKRNTATLLEAGVPEELVHGFLTHGAFSPRHSTEVSEYLAFLDGTANRGALLESALGAVNEDDALAVVRMARMLARYHESVAPLRALVASASVVIASAGDKDMAVVLPFDLLYWNEQTDKVFSRLEEFANRKGLGKRDLLLGGVISETATRQLARRGFRLHPRFLFVQ
ncbi:MAG: hypothetical protein R3286_16015 [Gammaproteobacteria bacterium]|nr:hypothetical protein [Gammaproteobacteria bacterium]